MSRTLSSCKHGFDICAALERFVENRWLFVAMLGSLITSRQLDENKYIPKAVEMAAEERLREVLMCVEVRVIFFKHINF